VGGADRRIYKVFPLLRTIYGSQMRLEVRFMQVQGLDWAAAFPPRIGCKMICQDSIVAVF